MPERGSKTNVVGASRLSNVWNFFVWRDPNDFLSRLMTMDETWLYHYDPETETKQQAMEWRHSGSPSPTPPRTAPPRPAAATAPARAPKCPSAKLHRKSSRFDFFGWIKTASTSSIIFHLGFQCLDQPPYSPALALSDYHLFRGLKKQLIGHHFSSNIKPQRPGWMDNL
jgi:hypothetical protein